METRIVEITEFTLKPGCTDEAFVQTADEVNEAARKLKGFVNRRLLKSERGWLEVLEWQDMQSAKSAGEVWASLPGLGPIARWWITPHLSSATIKLQRRRNKIAPLLRVKIFNLQGKPP